MHVLNVDLEIGSRRSLAPLIAELGANRRVLVLHTGTHDGLARAHYELIRSSPSADRTAMCLVRLVTGLSKPAMAAWRNARIRDFNVGIQASTTPLSIEVPLAATTVAAIAALGARIVVTVYAPRDTLHFIGP